MAKRKASPAQLAWRRKFAARYGGKSRTRSTARAVSTPIKRRARSFSMARRKRTYSRKATTGGIFLREVLPGMIYGAVGEPLLDKLASNFGLNMSDDIIKGVAGYVIATNTSGIFKSVGTAALNIAAYKLGKSGLGGLSSWFGGNSGTGNATSGGATF